MKGKPSRKKRPQITGEVEIIRMPETPGMKDRPARRPRRRIPANAKRDRK